MYEYDLQLHSNLSDGDHPVEEVIRQAKEKGLKGIAITDHNVWTGVNEKTRFAKEVGLEAIAGIEISARHKGVEVHILGYAKEFDEAVLAKRLQQTVQGYDSRCKEIVEKLATEGIEISFETLKANREANTPVVRYDIGKALAEKLGCSVDEAFAKYLNKGGPAYVPYGDWAMSPAEAIECIHKARGVAIFSHPGETLRKMGEEMFQEVQDRVIEKGIDGFEVYSSKHSKEDKKRFQKVAEEYDLLVTGGSDWHGELHHPEIKMGDGGVEEERFLKLKTVL